MDKILIRDLHVTTIVGTRPEERNTPRTVLFQLELETDLRPAGLSDDLTQSVNYEAVADELITLGKNASFLLIEALAEKAAAVILERFPAVAALHLTLEKTSALGAASSVAVSIDRRR